MNLDRQKADAKGGEVNTETAKLEAGEQCPVCFIGMLIQWRHRFSSDRGPNMPDADWLACDECDFATDPE